MKQHISEKQLDELTWDEQLKLCCLLHSTTVPQLLKHFEVTIGKMIELLRGTDNTGFVHFTVRKDISIVDSWKDNLDHTGCESVELCDSLWEAVKSIL
jgi:hypothetical protein